MQMIWDWDFTKELGLGSCFVSSQFSIDNNGSCTRMFKKRVEVIAFNQCWRDCQCAFHPPWKRTSDNPPLTTTRPKSHQGPSDDEMDQKPPQRSIGIAKMHSAGFIVEFITAKNPAQTEFINSRATNFPGLYRRERHRDRPNGYN